MIVFKNISKLKPFMILNQKYHKAISKKQSSPEIICISSYDPKKNEVNSRYVNLKIIDNEEFIFFTNYNSPKSIQFQEHNQIAGVFYWQKINMQIRMKGRIKKTSLDFNNHYFESRSLEKNALAISSSQSNTIDSYDKVKERFQKILSEGSLKKCPEYWGGFSFTPYSFEFWEGHENRLNKRVLYTLEESNWIKRFLQP